jgi:hypothetical protein
MLESSALQDACEQTFWLNSRRACCEMDRHPRLRRVLWFFFRVSAWECAGDAMSRGLSITLQTPTAESRNAARKGRFSGVPAFFLKPTFSPLSNML